MAILEVGFDDATTVLERSAVGMASPRQAHQVVRQCEERDCYLDAASGGVRARVRC